MLPWLLLILVACVIPISMRAVHAMNLLYTLLPLHLLFLLNATREKKKITTKTLAGLGITAASLPLVHNTGYIFVIATAIIVAGFSVPKRWRLSAAVLIVGMLPGIIVRQFLSQTASHHLAVGAGKESAWTYITQLIKGTAEFFCLPTLPCLPLVAGMILFLFVFRLPILRRRTSFYNDQGLPRPVHLLLMYSAVVMLLMFVVFNLIWIHDPLAGRFIFPQMLLISATAIALSLRLRSSTLGRGLAVVILLPLFLHLAGLIAVYQFNWNHHLPRTTPEHFITPNTAPTNNHTNSTP